MMLKDYMKFSDGRYMQAMFATGGAAILWAAFPNVATILLLIVSGGAWLARAAQGSADPFREMLMVARAQAQFSRDVQLLVDAGKISHLKAARLLAGIDPMTSSLKRELEFLRK